jgi:hypothetical protein
MDKDDCKSIAVNIHLWGRFKIMGWVGKFSVPVPPHYCGLAEAI